MKSEYQVLERSEAHLSAFRLKQALVDRGYHEAVTYSFVDQKLQRLMCPDSEVIPLANPMASDMGVMRVSLWPGLLNALQYNQNRQIQRVRLFELGMCFSVLPDGQWQQRTMLSGLVSGAAHSIQWGESERPVDFFDLKGDLQSLLALTRRDKDYRWVSAAHSALHPGQSAALYLGSNQIGWMGALHPDLVAELGLSQAPMLFELEFDPIVLCAMPRYRPVSKYPAVTRDIAVVLDQEVSAEAIQQKIQEVCGQLLNIIQIFDIYAGEGIASGKKSVALGLTFQDPSRTLVEDEINQIIDRVVAMLEHDFNAKLRA